MALRSYTWQNSYVNTPVNFLGEQNKLANAQNLVERSNANSNKVPIFPEALNFFLFFLQLIISSHNL